MVDRIKAAVDARTDPEFVIMARTDALAGEGIESAIDRAAACVDAGADMVFPEAVSELSAYRRFADAVRVPILANITEFGVTPMFTVDELAGAGVGLVLYSLSAFRAMNAAAIAVSETLPRDGNPERHSSPMPRRVTRMAGVVARAVGWTVHGWHQYSFYGSASPVVLRALALSEWSSQQVCLRGIPGAHKWGRLRHEETDSPKSIRARGQYITEP